MLDILLVLCLCHLFVNRAWGIRFRRHKHPTLTIPYATKAKAKANSNLTMNSEIINEDAHKKADMRISALPKDMQEDAKKPDLDGDGGLNALEMGLAITGIKKTKKANRSLKYTIVVFAVLTALLIGCNFASSITAARLAKDVEVSSDNGFAYVKGSDSKEIMKTAKALVVEEVTNIVLLSNDQLQRLSQLIFLDGDLKFNVKGYSRNQTSIMLLVEGGTITYDEAGIIDSTGNAKALLDHALGQDFEVADSNGDRRLNKYGNKHIVSFALIGTGYAESNKGCGFRQTC